MRSPGQSQHKTLKAATDYTNYTNYSSLILGQYRLSKVMVKMLYEELSYATVGAALEVHRVLGPGFLEAVYETALAHELTLRGIPFERQVSLHVPYKEIQAGEYRADFLIDGKIILEIKAVSSLNLAHEAQGHNYLATTGLRLAILFNFGTRSLQIKRIIR